MDRIGADLSAGVPFLDPGPLLPFLGYAWNFFGDREAMA
jgi:hypothetical protein